MSIPFPLCSHSSHGFSTTCYTFITGVVIRSKASAKLQKMWSKTVFGIMHTEHPLPLHLNIRSVVETPSPTPRRPTPPPSSTTLPHQTKWLSSKRGKSERGKENLMILTKSHAHFQTTSKGLVKLQRIRYKTVFGVTCTHTRPPLSLHMNSIWAPPPVHPPSPSPHPQPPPQKSSKCGKKRGK